MTDPDFTWTAHLGTSSGGGTLLVSALDGRTLTATATTPGFTQALDLLRQGGQVTFDTLARLLDTGTMIRERIATIPEAGERIGFDGRDLTFDGDRVDNTLSRHVLRLLREVNEDGYLPWVRFMLKLAVNPSAEARRMLYRWLDRHDFAITDTGDVIGYKGVRADGRSIHAGPGIVNGEPMNGHLPNDVGNVISIARSVVDPDRFSACSVGLHVGTHRYASSFAGLNGRVVTVTFNPRDAVAVPTSETSKLRVCRYRVVDVAPARPTNAALLVAFGWDDGDWHI